MTDDAVVSGIADGRPEIHCPWTVHFDEDGDPPHAPVCKDLLDSLNKLSPDSLAAAARMHYQAV